MTKIDDDAFRALIRSMRPCPFCGHQPEDMSSHDYIYPVTRPDENGRQVFQAGCDYSCGGCDAHVLGWSPQEAVANWNRRTSYETSEDLQKVFLAFKAAWLIQTALSSSSTEIAANWYYQKIISYGSPMIKIILEDLRLESNHWFAALRALTGENPVPSEHAGRIELMRADWINWGVEHGYLDR